MRAKNVDHLGSNLGGTPAGFALNKGKQAKVQSAGKVPVRGTDFGVQGQNTARLTPNPVFPVAKS